VKKSWSTWDHVTVHSAYLAVSGIIWKNQCSCSELLSCAVVTSKPFYILLMYLVYAVLGICCTWCTLYLVYAVFGPNWWSWCGAIEWDDLTMYSVMGVEWWTRKRDGGWPWDRYGGYERMWDMSDKTCWVGFGILHICLLTSLIGRHTCHVCNCKLTCKQNPLKSRFLIIMCPISSHLSWSLLQLFHHLGIQSYVVPHAISMP